MRGSSNPPPWSTIITSTAWTRISAPFFLKFCSYFPYNAKLCLNGHEYAKRQLDRAGCITLWTTASNPAPTPSASRVSAIPCRPRRSTPCCENGCAGCRTPFRPGDRQAGYRYQISILQIELSLTQVLDRPVSGRIFFEDVIRENLDIGRPKQVQLIFDGGVTKTTPGSFRTRVITDGVIPSLHIDYKGTRIKQYHKEGQALRTETTINNTKDFYIGKSLRNLPALRQIGFAANRRLLQVQTITHDSILAEETFQQLNNPRIVDHQRVSAPRFADPMVQAGWNALLLFDLLPAGFSNRELRMNLTSLLGQSAESFTPGRMTYQLRRLRLHGLIERIPKSHRYRLTSFGFRVAVFCTRTYTRILRPGLGLVLPATSSFPCPLRRSFDKLEQEVASWVKQAKLAT
jgi:DNA-binding HxlR family transcriptional regulator